jgi:aminocarboxymuconate-semialdehyde decarboxylase
MASLPMTSAQAAVAELDRVVKEHGIKGVILGTSVEGTNLADPKFRPVLKRCAELGVWILAHPYYVGNKEGLQNYYLTNLVGNPADTMMCGTHLIFGGVLEELPDLKVVLAHGGGLLPYLIGRLTHGHKVRDEAKVNTRTPPVDLLKRLYFDSILFDSRPLDYLIRLVGADRVVLGSDAPFDMGDPDPRGTVEKAVGTDQAALKQVLGSAAAAELMQEKFD